MANKLIPERLKEARENMGITMVEAARRLNLSKIGYCRYEYGDRSPSPQTIEVIAKYLNTSVDYLTGKTDDMSTDFVIISKDGNKELFELVNKLKSSDTDTISRLMAYYSKLKSK